MNRLEDYAMWRFSMIINSAYELQQMLQSEPRFEQAVQTLDSIIHACTDAKTAILLQDLKTPAAPEA